MNNENQNPLEQLHHIKSMMEKSSRFVSLSGWSGVGAGICALIGAFFAYQKINNSDNIDFYHSRSFSVRDTLTIDLLIIAVVVFISAFIVAFLFTYLRSQKQQIPIWGETSKRLLFNTALPIVVGGFFILKLVALNYVELVAPACLLFYGLGLVNGSKYTLGEIKYLGYTQIILGIISLFFIYHGLLFWTLGFGVMHIVYGIAMWRKYGN